MNELTPPPPSLNPLHPPGSAPPHPLDGKWHVHIEGQTYGPYTGHQLLEYAKEGRINGATQILAEGSQTWKTLGDEPRLNSILKSNHGSPPISPPIHAAPGATVVQVTNQIGMASSLLLEESLPAAKSPGIAAVLSFFICGAGQLYCGQIGKGLLMFVFSILLWVVLLGWVINIWSIFDAYSVAKKSNLQRLLLLQAMRPR